MDVMSIKLSPRAVTGKKVRTLRRQGVVPVHLYGTSAPSLTLQAEASMLRRVLPQVGTTKPLSVQVEGRDGEDICFVREVQRHPITDELLHVDFLRVDVTQKMVAEVPIILVGEAPAVGAKGGTLIHALHSVEVESLPMDLPASIQVDVSKLDDFEKEIRVRDIPVNPRVVIRTDADELIARVNPPVIERVAPAAEEAEEAEAAPAEAAEAEQEESA